ncbi:MAG: hypothetical protein ACRD4G_13635 [Bryobacteraceae bacterium]
MNSFILPAVAATAVIAGAGYGVNHYQALQKQVATVQAQLTATQTQLTTAQGQLATAKNELGTVGADIANAQAALTAAKNIIPLDAVAPPGSADPIPQPAIDGLQ